MAKKSLLLEFLGDTPEMKVTDFLMENYSFDYLKKDIAQGAGMSRITLYKVFPKLVGKGVVVETKRVGRARFYKINPSSPLVKQLYVLEQKLIQEFSKEIEQKQHILAKISA